MKEDYLRIDEKDNFIDSLIKSYIFLENAKTDNFSWKWFTIAIHHAAHCIMLYALQNTDNSGIWQKTIRREDGLIDVYNKDSRLIDFMTAFKWIQDPIRMGGYVGAKPFIAEQYHEMSMYHLNFRLRNLFIHFKPMGWSINKKYFMDVVGPVLEIIEFLVFKSGRCLFSEDNLKTISENLEKIRIQFNKNKI